MDLKLQWCVGLKKMLFSYCSHRVLCEETLICMVKYSSECVGSTPWQNDSRASKTALCSLLDGMSRSRKWHCGSQKWDSGQPSYALAKLKSVAGFSSGSIMCSLLLHPGWCAIITPVRRVKEKSQAVHNAAAQAVPSESCRHECCQARIDGLLHTLLLFCAFLCKAQWP